MVVVMVGYCGGVGYCAGAGYCGGAFDGGI